MTLFSLCCFGFVFFLSVFDMGKMTPNDLEAEILKLKRRVVVFTLTFNVNVELNPTILFESWQH